MADLWKPTPRCTCLACAGNRDRRLRMELTKTQGVVVAQVADLRRMNEYARSVEAERDRALELQAREGRLRLEAEVELEALREELAKATHCIAQVNEQRIQDLERAAEERPLWEQNVALRAALRDVRYWATQATSGGNHRRWTAIRKATELLGDADTFEGGRYA